MLGTDVDLERYLALGPLCAECDLRRLFLGSVTVEIEGLGLRVPASVQEVLDETLASETLERAIEEGWVRCRIHLATGRVRFHLAADVMSTP